MFVEDLEGVNNAIALDNKLGIADSSELARVEEKHSLLRGGLCFFASVYIT